MASAIRSLDCEANINSVFLRGGGTWDRAADRLRQIGARSLGFQKSGSSIPAVHDRCTTHTKPFLPLTTVLQPCRPRIMTSASREMDSGAALRASVISAFFSIRY